MNAGDKKTVDDYITARFFRYTAAVLIGTKEDVKPPNGTISLIRLGGRNLGVTCAHVIRAFEDKLVDNQATVMQLNKVLINPQERLIDIHDGLDLAVLDLSSLNLSERAGQWDIGTDFFHPPCWPPREVRIGDRLTILGFPGILKFYQEPKLWFITSSLGAVRVVDISDTRYVIQFDPKELTFTKGQIDHEFPKVFGGMSGGPAFLLDDLVDLDRICYWEFVGVVAEQPELVLGDTEQSEPDQILMIRKSRFIKESGMIEQEGRSSGG